MKFRFRYISNIVYDLELPRKQVMGELLIKKKNHIGTDQADIVINPPLVNIGAPRGRIRIHARLGNLGTGTRLYCRVNPFLFSFRSASLYIILSAVFWAIIAWLLPFNPLMIVLMIVYWVITCFVALYLIIAVLGLVTIYIGMTQFSNMPIMFLLMAWIITGLIAHLTLSYNRIGLHNWLDQFIGQIGKTKEKSTIVEA